MILEKIDLPLAATQGVEKLHQKDLYPEQESPPPYVGREACSSSADVARDVQNLAPSYRSNSLFQSVVQQHVNHISLQSKHNAITGSYILNPELPGSPLGGGISKRHHCERIPLDKRNRKLFNQSHIPNASFNTRHGAISLNLATAGASDKVTNTYVQVSSRHGKVHVNLFSLQPQKHICLEVSTRHGHIVVFIPPNFLGALQIRSRRGNVNFLPGFAQSARVVNGSDDGALVLFGQGDISLANIGDDTLDYCLLSTRAGRMTIGVSGVDHYDDAQGTSFLTKLGTLSTMLLGMDITK